MCEVFIYECEVNVISNGCSSILVPGSNDEASAQNYMENMENIFDAGKFTDVTIVCPGGTEFQCHKAILAGRSTVFEAMFTHEMKERRDNKVDIQDTDADTLREMLVYIYSNRVRNLEGKAAKLLVAAEKYNLRELKQICEDKLCLSLNEDNMLDLLILADLHCASNLRSLALRFFSDHGKNIVSQKECKEKLSSELMWDIINVFVNKK